MTVIIRRLAAAGVKGPHSLDDQAVLWGSDRLRRTWEGFSFFF